LFFVKLFFVVLCFWFLVQLLLLWVGLLSVSAALDINLNPDKLQAISFVGIFGFVKMITLIKENSAGKTNHFELFSIVYERLWNGYLCIRISV